MSTIDATRYDENNRHLLVKECFDQETNESYWIWCDPKDGNEHGVTRGRASKYAEFATLDEATDRALLHGYTYEVERFRFQAKSWVDTYILKEDI